MEQQKILASHSDAGIYCFGVREVGHFLLTVGGPQRGNNILGEDGVEESGHHYHWLGLDPFRHELVTLVLGSMNPAMKIVIKYDDENKPFLYQYIFYLFYIETYKIYNILRVKFVYNIN